MQEDKVEEQEEELKECLDELHAVLREDPLNEEVQQVGRCVCTTFSFSFSLSLCCCCCCCIAQRGRVISLVLLLFLFLSLCIYYPCRYGIACMNRYSK